MTIETLNIKNDPALTRRESEMLEYVTLGLSAKEIARHINISPRTVERHIECARLKLRARNRSHMIICAVQAGLLTVIGKDAHPILVPGSRNEPVEQS